MRSLAEIVRKGLKRKRPKVIRKTPFNVVTYNDELETCLRCGRTVAALKRRYLNEDGTKTIFFYKRCAYCQIDYLEENAFVDIGKKARDLKLHSLQKPEKLKSYYRVLESTKAKQTKEPQILENAEPKIVKKACLDYYGYSCQICGFDFKKEYGEDFDGIIQVHHIKPISYFEEEHEVDPIKDLIPVCPNCHVALHSKKNGVYAPDVLRTIIKRNRKGVKQ